MSYDDSLVTSASATYGVDAGLIRAVIQVESGGNPTAVSYAGANGLMQIVGGPFDPATNINQGTSILASNYATFGRWDLALAAYNAGVGNVQRYGTHILDYQYLVNDGWSTADAHQVTSYVPEVLALWGGDAGASSNQPPGIPSIAPSGAPALPKGAIALGIAAVLALTVAAVEL